MIISHRYRFIFIKTHKTAGSSFEMGLGPLCDGNDIISHMETNLDSGIPRNYHSKPRLGKLYDNNKLIRKLISRHSPLLGNYYYEHMSAARIRSLVGEDIWGSYYKFCFERNPWDKVVSYYLWKTQGQQKKLPLFHDYIMHKPHRLPCDANLYFEDDKPLVDKVYEYRLLSEAIEDLREKLGVPLSSDLPNEKTGISPDRKPYQEFYDEQTKERIKNLFGREIELMDYHFD